MTKEDKELLLQDLCARLPYGVVVHIHDINVDDYDRQLIPEDIDFIQLSKKDCKPYLRPMSSMTKKERCEYLNVCGNEMDNALSSPRYGGIDWLNKNHFDYRGLIPKGLAIAATKENNPYKSQHIDKAAIIAEINRIKKEECPIDTYEGRMKLFYFERFLSFLDTLE